MSLVVGVVVEGKDDFEPIQAVLEAELSVLGYPDIAFRQLQPEKDATGTTERGGWTKVVGWLVDHSGPGVETFFTPLFAGVPACDIIVVHIDSDVHVECLTKAGLSVPKAPASVADVVSSLRQALDNWLAVSADRRKSFSYAIPVFKTENWIMAAAADCPDATWQAEDAKIALRSLFDATKHKSVAAMKAQMISGMKSDTSNLRARAKSYQIFLQDLLESPLPAAA
jgi:hypothetical protein